MTFKCLYVPQFGTGILDQYMLSTLPYTYNGGFKGVKTINICQWRLLLRPTIAVAGSQSLFVFKSGSFASVRCHYSNGTLVLFN